MIDYTLTQISFEAGKFHRQMRGVFPRLRLNWVSKCSNSTSVRSGVPRPFDPANRLRVLDISRPHQLFSPARRLRRRVILHIGPTNSGKSHTALEAFKKAQRGFYAGPLRMLAREIFDRMAAEKIPCSLVTGDEVLEVPGATLRSGTVEMVDVSSEMDVAVIDEIQMIDDPDRGWAWTRAFLGVRAREVHLCGDPNSESLIRRLVKQTGDHLEVLRYERLSPLVLQESELKQPLINSLEPGDCIVCFSKREVRGWRDKLVRANKPCSIIYGSLPPETRAEQAKLFNDTQNGTDYLVASDAIGMGLNLAIRRIIFTTLRKFDGKRIITLPIPQIKQIAGRAGRFGRGQSEGLVNCATVKEKRLIRRALAAKSPEIKRAVCMPPDRVIRSATIGEPESQFSRTLARVMATAVVGADYSRPRVGASTEVAELFDRVWGLTFEDRLKLCNAPVSTSQPEVVDGFVRMCDVIGEGMVRNILQIVPWLKDLDELRPIQPQKLEAMHKVITVFLWLSYRFPSNFVDREGAIDLKRLCEHRLHKLLMSQRSLNPVPRSPTAYKSKSNSRTRTKTKSSLKKKISFAAEAVVKE